VNTLTIAAVSVREALRRKLQVNLLLFGLLLVLASLAVSALTIGEQRRIVVDLGLTAMEAIGSLIAVFLGASLVAGDIERRVIYPIVAKPVSRTEYLLGRYAGLAATLLLNLAVMALGLVVALSLSLSPKPFDLTLLAAIAMIGLQLLVVAAIAILFSSFVSSTLAAIFALAVVVAGHLSNDLITLLRGTNATLGKVLWYLLPNLGALTLNEAVVYRRPVDAAVWLAAGYAAMYAGAALALAALVFERRDFR
jgi:ABC-type transport system involved in multi-copper enzyme maturation permease subunit